MLNIESANRIKVKKRTFYDCFFFKKKQQLFTYLNQHKELKLIFVYIKSDILCETIEGFVCFVIRHFQQNFSYLGGQFPSYFLG